MFEFRLEENYIIKDKKKEKEKREKFYGSPWRQRKLFESPIYVTRDWLEILILFHSGLRSGAQRDII